MPTGLKIPVGVNHSGGVSLVSGDENDSKIIVAALGSDDNENAFQQNIGMGDSMVFDISDPTVRAKIIRKLLEIFRRFEAQQRFILRTNTIQWSQDSSEQELTLSFQYVQIESDEEKEFRHTFTSASGAPAAGV